MGTRPTPFPFSTRASTALAGWGHVPSPVPPQRGEEHTSPPLRWSQASIDGVAAAQPAASAKSGEWIGEGLAGPTGPTCGAARCGPRAG